MNPHAPDPRTVCLRHTDPLTIDQLSREQLVIGPHGTLNLPPVWFQYQWSDDPVPNRYWAWNTAGAIVVQSLMALSHPEDYLRHLTEYPIEHFEQPLANSEVDLSYCAKLSEDRLNTPVIGVTLPKWATGGQEVGVIIDGNHRIRARRDRGYRTVNLMYLPDSVSESFRLDDDTLRMLAELKLLGA